MTRRTIIWDSHCSSCRRWAVVLGWLDWCGLHRLVGSAEPGAMVDPRVTREDADRALQLLTTEGRFEGYDAIRRVLLRCPPTFWAAPLLWLPPVRAVGEWVYQCVAARRTCGVHSRSQKPIRSRGRLLGLLALVVVQLAIPLWATAHGVPRMFGFHMFTGRPGHMTVEVLDSVGEGVDVELSEWIAERRDEIDWRERLGRAICQDVRDAASVTITQWGEPGVTRCAG